MKDGELYTAFIGELGIATVYASNADDAIIAIEAKLKAQNKDAILKRWKEAHCPMDFRHSKGGE